MEPNQTIDALVEKHNSKEFMYIEYPHKSFWSEKFSQKDIKEALSQLSGIQKDEPLTLYVHFPYCTKPCFFCTCHFEITKDHDKAKDYLKTLSNEISLYRKFFEENSINPNFVEVHLGGGSPTFLDEEEFDYLVDAINPIANIKNLDEFAIEIDPRFVSEERMKYYHEKGINRVSFGLQDFDINVQRAVNRVQPSELVRRLIAPDIRKLFKNGVSFDIICGLPLQTEDGIRKTFEEIIELSPDRVCFNYLDFAPRFAQHQNIMIDGRNGRPNSLPDARERKHLFKQGLKVLTENGYLRAGYEHFTKIEDAIGKALKEGKMHWNALGATPGRSVDVIGVGPHSASTLGNFYFQNIYGVESHKSLVNKDLFPVFRGHKLSQDDIIRRDIIRKLRNYFSVDYATIEKAYNIKFPEYFNREIEQLGDLAKDGILSYSDKAIEITEAGREFTLHVCRVFDKYKQSSIQSS